MFTISFYIFCILCMVFIPVLLAVLLRRRFQVPWLLFCVGSLTFIGSQIVHFPLNDFLVTLNLLPENQLASDLPVWQTALFLGLTAGLCEELARALGYLILRRFRKLEDGLMLGLGHGGIESMIFGGAMVAGVLSSYIAFKGADLSSMGMTALQIEYLSEQINVISSSPFTAITPLFERLIAMCVHVVLSLVVLQAFRKKNGFYILAAILYHALIDGVLVYCSFIGWEIWQVHLGFIAILIPGVVWAFFAWRKDWQAAKPRPVSSGVELRVFWLALQKELRQQWRSKKLLVVLAVFLVFGLMSPAFAKFTPEILKSVEGAEQFADMIPEPQMSDAVAQYIKNITQFGFVLAVLLGMGAVVGEKEKGTAAMILSKPMPRWVFVLSKFFAQFLVYLLAFVLAGIGAYYYTLLMFGPLPAGEFALINLLLFSWLMTFVGVTLLGSVIAKSTGAAAGIGLGLSVALLLAGNIPTIGGLAPGALVAWASQLGMGETTEMLIPNGSALLMALVIVLISLLASLAVFERQEL